MLITMEMIYNELLEIKKKIIKLEKQAIDFELESVSITKAAELLHIGEVRIKNLIGNKRLKSFSVDGRTRIKLSELKRFQDSDEEYQYVKNGNGKTAMEIAREIFK